ncbi:MAG: AMP-binding protein [Oligoflexia bacterium]|nr:AMP-binding protein [Oligoflexia bacterium]
MTIDSLLDKSFLDYPKKAAIEYNKKELTYQDLHYSSNFIINKYLINLSSSDIVAVHLDKSFLAIQFIVALIRAKIPYAPIDTKLPNQRKVELINLLNPKIILTKSAILSIENNDTTEIIVSESDILFEPKNPIVKQTAPNYPAYYLFTSGTTGTPKIIEISQLAACTFVEWANHYVKLSSSDRVISLAPLNFDLSIFDIFSTLSCGATIVIPPIGIHTFPSDLSTFLEEEKISIMYAVPTTFRFLSLHGNLKNRNLSQLRAILCAGDKFPTEAAQKYFESFSNTEIYNFYGPAETNVCMAHKWDPKKDIDNVPIGVPIAGDTCLLLKEDGSIVADTNESGEIIVSGPTVMNGYYSSSSGLSTPFIKLNNQLFYKTGDLANVNASGVFSYLSRRSGLIKSFGYRVHPSEIESVIKKLAYIKDCVAVGIPDRNAGELIYTLASTDENPSNLELNVKQFLSELLPGYMIPQGILFCKDIPYMENGKINRTEVLKRLKEKYE